MPRLRRLTLSDFLNDRWLPAIEATVKPSTLMCYSIHVQRHIAPALGHIHLHRLDAKAINDFYRSLLSSGHHRPLSSSTVRRIHATLHRALRDATRWGLLSVNPATSADPPRERSGATSMTTWSAQHLRAFLEGTRGESDHALWVVLASTGLRRGEALGLRWEDIDLKRGTLAVRRTVVRVGAKIIVSTPKTIKGNRVVALDETTLRSLVALKRPADRSGFAFGGANPLDPASVSDRFRRLVRAMSLPRIRLHDLRHTHASLALQAGVHPKIVSERLGHSTVGITLDIYSHVGSTLQREAAAQIERLILEA